MKNISFRKALCIAIVATAAISAFSFTVPNSDKLGVILNHIIDPQFGNQTELLAIPIDQTDKINCHFSHGDTEYPYNEELYKRLIITQEDGDDFCKW